MQLLVTVRRPRETVGYDLLVTTPPEATVGELARFLDDQVPHGGPRHPGPTPPGQDGSPHPDPPPGLWDGRTLLEAGARLGDGPVRDGMMLGLGAPVPGILEPTGVVEVRVVAGPGAGAVHRLGLGHYTLGGPGCDVCPVGLGEETRALATIEVAAGGTVRLHPVDEAASREAPVLAPRHRPLPGPLVLDAPATAGRRRRRLLRRDPEAVLGGKEQRDPEGPRLLIELDRRQVEPGAVWRQGALLTVGSNLLTAGPVPAADAVTTPTPEEPSVDFNRPPRLSRPERTTEFTLPTQPERLRKAPIPLTVMLSPIVMGGAMFLMTGRAYSLLFVILSPLMMIANVVQGRSNSKRQYREAMRRYREQRTTVEDAAWEALTQERRQRRLDCPDAAELLLRATGPRAALWERRPGDPDWLELRVGTADQPSGVLMHDPARARHEEPLVWTAPDVPVSVHLGRLGVVGVTGTRRERVAAWLTAQCATLHSPTELGVVLLIDPGQGAAGARRWDWCRWLPHLRTEPGAPARVGLDEESVSRRVNELLTVLDARAQGEEVGERAVVVLDGAHALRLRPGVVRLLREGPAAGLRLVCVDTDRTSLPQECRAVVDTTGPTPSVSQTDAYTVEHVLLDEPGDDWCERLARALAPVRDVSALADDGAVPSSSRLLDVLGMPEARLEDVLRSWRRARPTTRAVIGEDAEGTFTVDVRADGPHALIAGTTGSGKSELLQTLIASLCVGNTPASMTFVLVDYKGGAAFKDCARLPHTVGMVTDLDGHLTSRALESLGAELRRRERQLAAADAKDIEDYTAATGPQDEPMPRLVIIIDEFAALVAELPDFVTGLVDIARRGRSLGVHLVLATQRPAGVVSAEIKSNTNLRIALRVTDENDSQDVIESSASAHIPPALPGRAYARLGHASLHPFQASRVGGRPPGSGPRAPLRSRSLSLSGLAHREVAPPQAEEDATVPTDLSRLVGSMGRAREELGIALPHRPWLPPLPAVVTMDGLHDLLAAQAGPGGGQGEPGDGARGAEGAGPAGAVDPRARGLLPPLVLGLEDCPGEQAQKVMTWDYTCAGHLGVAGSAGSGRSTLLRGIAAEVARTTSPEEVHVYGIDAGTGALLPCTRLPHVGAVVTRDQPERLRRLLDLLGREVTRRQQRLALDGLASVAEQRLAAGPQERLPYLLLLIDRWDSYVASFESVDGGALVERVELLLREGGAVGLHVVMAGDQTVCRGRMGMMLEDRLALRLPAAENYDMVGMRPRDVPVSMPSGRAFRAGARPREVQVGLLDASPAGTAQVAAVHALARQAGRQWSQVPRSRCPRHVDELPVAISLTQALALGPPPGRGSFCLAVGGDDLGLLPLRMEEVGNGVLVTGPRRSGRSTALYVGALTALDAGAQVVAVAPGRSPLRCLQGRPGVLGVLGEDAVAADLLGLIRHAPSEVLLVVDDFEFLGPDHKLAPVLEKHLKTCRDAPGGVLVSCGVDEIQGLYRGLVGQVRKNRTGLLLAPRSADDGSYLSARLPRSVGAPVPMGRGILVTAHRWTWVQVPDARP